MRTGKRITLTWLILALVSAVLGIGGFLDQALRLKMKWDWSQVWHHEPLVMLALGVSVTLYIIFLVETLRR